MQIEQFKIYIEKPLCAIEIKIKCFYGFFEPMQKNFEGLSKIKGRVIQFSMRKIAICRILGI